jgi:hypothetical protein
MGKQVSWEVQPGYQDHDLSLDVEAGFWSSGMNPSNEKNATAFCEFQSF